MLNIKSYKDAFETGLGILALVMLVAPTFITITILAFLLVLIIGAIKKQLSFQWNTMNTLFVAFYLAYFIGMFFTDNQELANKYLEYKLAFLVFPLIFSLSPRAEISMRKPALAAIFGVLILSVLGWIHSFQLFAENGSYSSFFGGYFSNIHHPTYYSFFALFTLVLINEAWKKKWLGSNLGLYLGIGLWLVLVQLLTVSLAGVLFLLMFGIYLILLFIKNRFGKNWFVGTLILSPMVLFTLLNYTPGISTQFNTSKKFITEYVKNPVSFVEAEQTYVQGDETRLIMWTVAALEIIDHPLGVGTGNTDDHLRERLLGYGQNEVASHNYNPHNQFLQVTLEIGLIGLMIFLAIIGYSLYQGMSYKNNLVIVLTLSLAFNCLFESMLQRQSGIVFFTFWICLLAAVKLYPKVELEEE